MATEGEKERLFVREYALPELPAVVEALRTWASGVPRWLLYGPLGAGKTALVRAWVGSEAHSPTFSYIHHYPHAVHVDLYRFPADIPSRWAELEELLETAPLLFIEWADLLPFPVPLPAVEVSLEPISEERRRLRAYLQLPSL